MVKLLPFNLNFLSAALRHSPGWGRLFVFRKPPVHHAGGFHFGCGGRRRTDPPLFRRPGRNRPGSISRWAASREAVRQLAQPRNAERIVEVERPHAFAKSSSPTRTAFTPSLLSSLRIGLRQKPLNRGSQQLLSVNIQLAGSFINPSQQARRQNQPENHFPRCFRRLQRGRIVNRFHLSTPFVFSPIHRDRCQ